MLLEQNKMQWLDERPEVVAETSEEKKERKGCEWDGNGHQYDGKCIRDR